MEDLKKASVDIATLRDTVSALVEKVEFPNPAAGEALEKAAKHLTDATQELREANRLVDEKEAADANLKRTPPG